MPPNQLRLKTNAVMMLLRNIWTLQWDQADRPKAAQELGEGQHTAWQVCRKDSADSNGQQCATRILQEMRGHARVGTTAFRNGKNSRCRETFCHPSSSARARLADTLTWT